MCLYKGCGQYISILYTIIIELIFPLTTTLHDFLNFIINFLFLFTEDPEIEVITFEMNYLFILPNLISMSYHLSPYSLTKELFNWVTLLEVQTFICSKH